MPDARYGANAPITFRMGGMQVEALYYGADLIWPAGHIISIPADEINWTDYAPLILSGVHVRVPVDVLSWQDFEPSVELDGVAIPVDSLDWIDYAPSVSSGAHVHVPLDAMQWADFAPVVGTSAIVDMPLDTLAWVDYAPTVSAGASVSLPFDTMEWADFTPLVSAGANVSLPVDEWKWGDYSPNLGYAFSKAFSSAFNAIPHDYGVVAPVDGWGWSDFAPQVEAFTDIEFSYVGALQDSILINVGLPAPNRYIYIMYFPFDTGANRTLTSATIGGVTATIIDQRYSNPATDVYVGCVLVRVLLPLGETASHSLTWSSGSPERVVGTIYRVAGVQNPNPLDIVSRNISVSGNWSESLDVHQGGFTLCGIHTSGQASRTITSPQMTRNLVYPGTSIPKLNAFSALESTSASNKTFNFTASDNNSGPIILASFR